MLNRRESEIMNAVYSLCRDEGVCLISPAELMSLLPAKRRYTQEQVEKILNSLALDDYFQLLSSSRKGEKMYVISLHANGYAFPRFNVQQRRNFAVKLGWAITSAIIAFLVGFILKRIF